MSITPVNTSPPKRLHSKATRSNVLETIMVNSNLRMDVERTVTQQVLCNSEVPTKKAGVLLLFQWASEVLTWCTA